MPRNGAGVYTLPEPAFVNGTTADATTVNSDLDDIAEAITDSLDRNGTGGMAAALGLDDDGFNYVGDTDTGRRRSAANTQVDFCGSTDVWTLGSASVTVHIPVTFSGALTCSAAVTFNSTVTFASPLGTSNIADNAITFAKMQNISANVVLGSVAGGDPAEITCTAAGRALLDDASASDQRTTLGLGTAAVQNTGTSGANVPLLNGTNTWSGANTFSNAAGIAAPNTLKAFGRVVAGVLQAGSFNVASVVDNGLNYTVTFTSALADANYAVQLTPGSLSTGITRMGYDSTTTTDFLVEGFNGTGGALGAADPGHWSFAVYSAS